MRLIDAVAYAAEMAKRQDACGKWMDSAIDELTLQRAEGAYTMLCEAKLTLDKMPTIDAVPVVHGEWITTEETEWGIFPFKKKTCSVCDCKIDHTFMLACMDYFDDKDTVFHYCPNCGARMDGERRET